jgi:hypothetical protein
MRAVSRLPWPEAASRICNERRNYTAEAKSDLDDRLPARL